MDKEEEKPKGKGFIKAKILKARLKSGELYFSSLTHQELINMAVEMRAKALEHDSEIRALNNKISELEARLQKYEPKEGVRPDYTGYQNEWSNVRKIVFVLKRNFNALTSIQIMNELLRLEPVYKILWRNPANCVSRLLRVHSNTLKCL